MRRKGSLTTLGEGRMNSEKTNKWRKGPETSRDKGRKWRKRLNREPEEGKLSFELFRGTMKIQGNQNRNYLELTNKKKGRRRK